MVTQGMSAPCRLCLRFTPVEVICHADLDSMRQAAAKLVPPHFPGGADATPVAFAVSQSSTCRLLRKAAKLMNTRCASEALCEGL